jgi:phospholipase A1
MEECLLAGLEDADDSMTIGSLRIRCEDEVGDVSKTPPQDESAVVQYIRSDTDIENRNYLISVHNQNYILAYTHNSELNVEPWKEVTTPENVAAFSEEEAIFQVSAKFALWRNMFSKNTDLYFAYTQKSWWQIYTDEADLSKPFRESNYEPEVFARYYGGPKLGSAGRIAALDVGYVHQSNGRADVGEGSLNRSWDRLMGRATFDLNDFAVILRAWWAFSESDDNPNMYRYMGWGDIRAVWAPNKHTFGLMIRPGTEEIGVEASWSWQMTKSLRLYTQYYYGYGESLLDYNAKTNRFGIGVMFNDFLMNK